MFEDSVHPIRNICAAKNQFKTQTDSELS